MTVTIKVRNPGGVCRGVKRLMVDGRRQAGTLIPVETLRDGCTVEVELG